MNPFPMIDYCAKVLEETGVNPFRIYCQVTGKIIGTVEPSEIDLAIQLCGDVDEEEIRDELLTRTLASARPSPAWNYIRIDTLDRLRQLEPRTTLAYLFNKLAEPVDNANRLTMTLERRIALIHERIKICTIAQAIDVESELIDNLLLALIEIDARFGLQNVPIPTGFRDHWDTMHPSDFKALTRKCCEWRDRMVAEELERQQQQAWSDRSYSRGSTPAKLAFIREIKRVTPPSETKVKALAKKASLDRMGDLFDELESVLTGEVHDEEMLEVMTRPIEVVPVVRQLKAGFKFGGKKLESVA
jgi:hypothetical protein